MLDLKVMIDSAPIALTVFFLALGSYLDIKTREVSDKVWLAYGTMSLALTAFAVIREPGQAALTLSSIALATLASLALYFSGVYGGADAKAIICLAVALPLNPSGLDPLTGYVHPYFPLTVLVYGYISTVPVLLWITSKNIIGLLSERSGVFTGLASEPTWKKLAAILTGYRVSPSKFRSTFYLYPLEEVIEDSGGFRRRFRLLSDLESRHEESIMKLLRSIDLENPASKVWVTPGLPMLVFIFTGFIFTIVFGDPLFKLAFHLSTR